MLLFKLGEMDHVLYEITISKLIVLAFKIFFYKLQQLKEEKLCLRKPVVSSLPGASIVPSSCHAAHLVLQKLLIRLWVDVCV